MSTGLENVIRSMFAAVDVSPVWFRIVLRGMREVEYKNCLVGSFLGESA